MKKITLDISFSNNKKISLLFDIGDKFEIPTITQAKNYKYDLSRLIKDNIIMLSDLQAKVYSSYRSNYLQLPPRTQRDILRNITHFDQAIDGVFKEYSEGNGSFVFMAIEDCYSSITNSALLLKEHGQKYKSYVLKNEMYALLGHLDNLDRNFTVQKKNLDMNFTYRKRKIQVVSLNNAM